MTDTSTTIKTKSIDDKLDDLETFIARRFDEISMEIEATSQLMEMAEEDAGKRFADMLAVLNAVSSAGDGSSPANSGRELEAVIQETESAATKIMDAADKIRSILEEYDEDFSSDMRMATISESIYMQVQNILLACEFQDLVSQRVATALKNIREVQETMDNTLSKFGIDTKAAKEKGILDSESSANGAEKVASQDDIDALFN